MQLYCLYEFNKKFICASINEPQGRNGSVLIGKRGTTKEEIFAMGVYRLYPIQRPDKPVYKGNEDEIRDFLNVHDNIVAFADEMRPLAEQYDK